MNSNESRPQNRRQPRGGRRRQPDQRGNGRDFTPRQQGPRNEGPRPKSATPAAQPKIGFWKKLINFFTGGGKKPAAKATPPRAERTERPANRTERPESAERHTPRPKPEPIEVTSPKLYVGNLSYDATESDLFELFKGVGDVQNAEVVTLKGSYKSKGFGFVTMMTVDEAKRAVATLHDKPFMGRKLVVNGSRSTGPRE